MNPSELDILAAKDLDELTCDFCSEPCPPRFMVAAGKTSIAKALATHFGMDVYYLPLSDLDEDSKLLNTIAQVTPGSMLLLGDVDTLNLTHDREKAENPEVSVTVGPTVSLSALLNALDGIASPHGLITVMTTNYPDRLDEALIRPGRVDRSEAIGFLDDTQLLRLYRNGLRDGPAAAVHPDRVEPVDR